MNWRKLGRAWLWTNAITLGSGLLKAEVTIYAANNYDAAGERVAAYGVAVLLMVVVSPINTWLAWRLQR